MSEMLWKPSEDSVRNTNMFRFMGFVNDRYQTSFTDYESLYRWSIDNIPEF